MLLGFWGTAILVLVPYFLVLAFLLARAVPQTGKWLAAQFLLLGIVYPCLAGLDAHRQSLYLNLCALVFLAFATRLLLKNVMGRKIPGHETTAVQPAV